MVCKLLLALYVCTFTFLHNGFSVDSNIKNKNKTTFYFMSISNNHQLLILGDKTDSKAKTQLWYH